MKKIKYIVGCLVLALCSCGSDTPKKYTEALDSLRVYPDYRDVTVPVNISPLNFYVENEVDEVVASLTAADGKKLITSCGSDRKVCFSQSEWVQFIGTHAGESLTMDIYTRKKEWVHYSAGAIQVVKDSIDPYITFRLIEPSYMSTGNIGLYQHNMQTAELYNFVSNKKFKQDASHKGQLCMNCHSKQLNHPENSLFHYRVSNGGLILTYKGETHVISTKVGDMIKPAVYAQWHPSLPFIAFSNNTVYQKFPSMDLCKIEALESRSDLLLFDLEKREISYIRKTKTKTETYPTWSPDGKYLYYCSTDSIMLPDSKNLKNIKHDLMRVAFNADSVSWGEPELVYSASSIGKSVSKPRVSPDGKYVAMTISEYGAYHYTHPEADIYLYDIEKKECRPLTVVNTPEAEGYVTWSTNGRWLMVGSRAEDGNYARVYFSYFDENGVAHKPFHLPHADPLYDRNLLQNYNYPEFGAVAIDYTPEDIYSVIEKNEPIVPTYRGTIELQADGNTGATNLMR